MRFNCLAVAGIFGFIAVAAGALGAHALKQIVLPDKLEAWETAVRFLFFHALVFLFCGLYPKPAVKGWLKYAAAFWFAGTILFSCSVFLLVAAPLFSLNVAYLGPVTPVGGIFLLAGWFCLIVFAFRKTQPVQP